jgi:hypothetical protein
MNKTYYLGPDRTPWTLEDNFPTGGKMAVLFSGGVESTLIASIAVEIYGRENVILLWTDSVFCDNNPVIKPSIKFNVETVAAHLGMEPVYVPVDWAAYCRDPLTTHRQAWNSARDSLGFDHLAMGMTAMFWDIGPLQQLTKQEIIDYCNSDRVRFWPMIEQFHMDTDLYTEYPRMNIDPNVYQWLKTNSGKEILFSLGTLHKQEVIDLYYQLGKQDLLYKTLSCLVATGRHCGRCFDCQNRYDAHDILRIEDLTNYDDDLIKKHRARLK